jgi:hypothetical protein
MKGSLNYLSVKAERSLNPPSVFSERDNSSRETTPSKISLYWKVHDVD